jgi:D-alanyl-D-alanine carboxypeptidase
MAIGKRRLRNTNALLRLMESADGMKTGFTCPAGFNLVATANEHNRRMMAVVLGAASGRSRAEYAQELLRTGFAGTRSSTTRLTEIANVVGGSRPTTDMSSEACGRGRGVPLTTASSLKGYGASLGSFQTRTDAKQALDDWTADPAAKLAGVSSGVVRMTNPGGFAVMVWDIDESQARALCATLSSRNASCLLMTPAAFEQMAAEAKAQAKPARKSKRKRRKK